MSSAVERFGDGTAFVTGGAAGIGEGFVRHLAAIGMRVVIADVNLPAAQKLADELVEAGRRATAIELDVTSADQVDRIARQMFEDYGSVELLINNAGVENAGLLWEVTPARWKQVMDINVDGVFYGIHSFVPLMIEAGKPAVIANLSSVGGVGSAPVQAPYMVSKHAVLALTECLYQEVALVGAPIQVSAVLPHSIRSQIFLAARRDAPSANPVANGVFDAMQAANVATGLDPVEAAEHMTEAIARGDFWIFSDDLICRESTSRRATQLADLTPPPDPRVMLDRMGIDPIGVGLSA
ncbi:SDR family NAD(P)-dependent oxidoreductase [Micromonospora sp. NPDC005206]|uniref:SDR family NAD(P)-dependent oxidoreductase n=1 Tax=Micromonospora sp. NPDC005206 TaxID=3157022 RepID=UPI0033B95B25